MAKLILSMDQQVLKEIPLSKERITIGRKPHNDVQIDNLAVSGEHAVIVSIQNDSFLEDLGSTNGTMVNGKPIKKHFLQDNDVVELGKYKLKYVVEKGKPQAAAPAAADFEKTMVLRPGAMKAAVEQARAMAAGGQPATAEAARAAAVQQVAASAAAAGVADKDAKTAPAQAPAPARPAAAPAAPIAPAAPVAQSAPAVAAAAPAAPVAQSAPAVAAAAPAAPAAAAAPVAPVAPAAPKPAQQIGAIQLLSGANAGKQLDLLKPLTTLGKPGVQVAVLTRRPQGYFITHVEGVQLPVVNGQAIGNAPHALKDHDVIELAGVKLEFFLKG